MTALTSNTAHSLAQLLHIKPPAPPHDFAAFWQARYQQALTVQPHPRLSHSGTHRAFDIYDLHYTSTNAFNIGGWLLIPRHTPVTRGAVIGHGYGGRDAPDVNLPLPSGTACLFPCFRGLSRSQRPPISNQPHYHVLHDLDKKDQYILGGCVEDLWLAVSALLSLYPAAQQHLAYLGMSFGGGIGALALPWDSRIQRAHFNVPTFGHHPLRMTQPTWGSAAAIQTFHRQHPQLHVLDTLAYYDAAIAAQFIRVPTHIAAALVDPIVTPFGQFAIYNALTSTKQLFLLEQGHADYPHRAAQEVALWLELQEFFAPL